MTGADVSIVVIDAFSACSLGARAVVQARQITDAIESAVSSRSRKRRQAAPRKVILPANLPPIGLSLEEVAAYIGISANKYIELMRRGLMPSPRIIDGRRVHDRELAHAAFKRLPTTAG